jgi:hypothetical protein
VTRFRCVVCGKMTAGRLPRDGRHFPGDGSGRYPRRHKGVDGKPCKGNIELVDWVDEETGFVSKPAKLPKVPRDVQSRAFVAACVSHGLPEPIPELRFCESRRWRFDWAFPTFSTAVELEGGAFVGGRHNSGLGFEKDIEKYAEAMCLGWIVLRVTPRHVRNGKVFEWLRRIQQSQVLQ